MDKRDYFPIYEGMQESSTKINKLPRYEDSRDRIFHFDEDEDRVLAWKEKVLKESPRRYFCALSNMNLEPINNYIMTTLAVENRTRFGLRLYKRKHRGEYFTLHDARSGKYISSGSGNHVEVFLELSKIIQEDLIVVTDLGNGKDMVTAISLTMPSDWGAEYAIGRSFDEIHARIPRIDKIMPNPNRLVRMMIYSPFEFERIGAVNFRDGNYLSRHQDLVKPVEFDPANPELYLRYERQTTKGFPGIQSFLLTVKAYFEPCNNPDPKKKAAIISAFEEKNPKANAAPFIEKYGEEILKWLKK